jgi:hypothetical protein
MSASDLVTVVVAGAVLFIAYKSLGNQQPAVAPTGAATQQVQYQQQQPQVVYVQNPNQPLRAQLAPQIVYVPMPAATTPTANNSAQQAAFDEQAYNEYLQSAMSMGQIPKENIAGVGPSWLGCI